MRSRRVIILGSGPAGLTAAIYTARAGLVPLVVAGQMPGGQLTITTDVENYPGYPEGVQGPQLMEDLRRQAERFGSEFMAGDIPQVHLSERPFTVVPDVGEALRTEALIIATGASARWLELPSERRLRNRGISACATCDGFFFREKAVAVVGGGDTAMEESLFLTRFASTVTLIHRRDTLRASQVMQERVLHHPKITLVWNSIVQEVLGDTHVTGLHLRDTRSGAERTLEVEGLFVAIGHTPNTHIFQPQLACDAEGYLLVDPGSTRTSVEGVFACGDAVDKVYRQAISAAGSGCMAALDAERWLSAQQLG